MTNVMSCHASGAKKRMTKKIYFSHNLEIIKNERVISLRKSKHLTLSTLLSGTVLAGLSMFTDIFEKGNFEAILKFGLEFVACLCQPILITMAKVFISILSLWVKN